MPGASSPECEFGGHAGNKLSKHVNAEGSPVKRGVWEDRATEIGTFWHFPHADGRSR
jgi:hypothetical protein